MLGCGPSTKGVVHVLTGKSTLTAGKAQYRLMVREQPEGPDANFRTFLDVASASPGARTAWDPARQARFESLLAEADLLKPGSPEVHALRDEFREALALWRIRRGRQAARRGLSLPETFVNSIGITLKLMRPDGFLMGSEDGDSDERPVHSVKFARPFYMGVYEITGSQYSRVMGGPGGLGPKTLVSWHEAMEFCRRLSAKEGVTYTLPTEAQWEYACRAGTQTAYSFGSAWSDAASRKPNPWGLYDMHGNMREWCSDWYGSYGDGVFRDPKGPADGSSRVLRGGQMSESPWCCRVSSRHGASSGERVHGVSFRVVVLLSPEP